MVFEENNANLETNPETESTSSSESYSYLFQDLEDPENTVKEEWEAIERTLYQEKGKQINNPALLKECRLWNETFPHLRIRGTQLEDTKAKQSHEKGVGPETSITKCVQTTNAQPGWVKLNEQRECIKKQVVNQLVQRLISKFNLSKDNPTGVLQYFDKIDLEKKSGGKNENKKSNSNVPTATEKLEMECYFERGKLQEKINAANKTKELENKKNNLKFKDYSDLSESLEKEFNVRFLSNSMINEKNNLLRSLKTPGRCESNFLKKDLMYEKQEVIQPYGLKKEGILKKEKKAPKITESKPKLDLPSPTDSLSSLAKPFEATKKVDKKYEVLLESILKNKGLNFPEPETNKTAEIPKPEVKSYKESIGKLRVNANYDDYLKRHKQLPKINNFTNNWISRTDNYSYKEFNTAMTEIKKEKPIIKLAEGCISSSTLQVPRNNWVSNSKSSADIGKKGNVKFSKSNRSMKNEIEFDDVRLERPKLFIRSNKNVVPQTYKSSSCGDLHKRKPEFSNGRVMKSGGESKKSNACSKNSSRVNYDKGKINSKTNLNRDVNLPPIETGIIITELNTRPKMPTRIQPRKYT